MSRALTATTTQAMMAQETGESFPVLLTIPHKNLSAPIRVTDNNVDLASGGASCCRRSLWIRAPSRTLSATSLQ